MRSKASSMGWLLAVCVFNSYAVTLGSLQGSAWLGRRLDVTVLAQLDSGVSTTGVCASAEVSFADSPLNSALVNVVTSPTGKPNEVAVRVTTTTIVDEPVVTVRLRVGCGSEVIRRYVLFPDAPVDIAVTQPILPRVDIPDRSGTGRAEVSDTSSTNPTTDVGVQAVTPTPTSTPATRPQKSQPASKPPLNAQKAKPEARQTAPAAKATAAPANSTFAEAGGGRGRLTLEPMIIPIKREEPAPTPENSQRSELDSQLVQRVEQLQQEVKTMLDQAAANAKSQSELLVKLKQVEEDRQQHTLIFGFGALLLLCLTATILYLNRSVRRLQATGSVQHFTPITPPDPASSAEPPVVPQFEVAQKATATNWATEEDKGLSVVVLDPESTRGSPLESPEPDEAVNTHMSAFALDFHSDTQLALLDQARLFVRLDNPTYAIDLLEERIRLRASDCPLVFLELLKIAHDANLKVDFRQFRDEMQQVFNVIIPDFALLNESGRNLADYPDIAAQLKALGHTLTALQVIESHLLLGAWAEGLEPLDLPAFKELVELHGQILSGLQPHPVAPSGGSGLTSSGPVDIDISL